MRIETIIQAFEAAIANGGYGGLRYLSPESELLLLSIYDYVFDTAWVNEDGQDLTPEQKDTIDTLVSRAQGELMSNAAIGQIIWSMVNPSNISDSYLLANGQSIFETDYPELASVLGTEWADPLLPSRYFLPNLIDAYPQGATGGNMRTRIGANTHQLTINEMPSHTHGYTRTIITPVTFTPTPSPATFTQHQPASTSPAGGNQAHENRPLSQRLYPYVVAR